MKTSTITSRHNSLLQEIRRALAQGRPTSEGTVVAEGPHLLEEALRGLWHVECVLTTAAARDRFAELLGRVPTEVLEVAAAALASVESTEHGQGLMALLRPRLFTWRDLFPAAKAFVLVLDGLQDPGNAGTLVRSAEAFGATGVAFLRSSVRIANPKFLRATAGSIFRIPFLEGVDTAELLSRLQQESIGLWALAAQGATSVLQADLRSSCAVAVGSEGRGVSAELLGAARSLCIPSHSVESLNAAVAGSIALFEARRQRA